MTRAIDLNSKEWRDLVFANKNQLYGAYEIRKTSSKRHLMSLGIVVLLVATFSVLPTAIKKLFPTETLGNKDVDGRVTLIEINPLKEVEKIIEIAKPVEPVLDLKKTIQFTPPVITEDSKVPEGSEVPLQNLLSNTDATISSVTNEGVPGGTIDPATLVDNTITGNNSSNNIIEFAEVMPEPIGGIKDLMGYLGKNIRYPMDAQERGIQGTVVLRFVVDKDGSIKDITVVRPLDPSCDKEAVRVVKSMANWIPGRQNGNPVAVYFTLPIKFKLHN